MTSEQTHWVSKARQIKALVSPVRQRMMDRLEAVGPRSARQLAASLGLAHDAIYYHIRVLQAATLIKRIGTQARSRRDEAVYDVIAPHWQIAYRLDDQANIGAVRQVARAMLQQAYRDFEEGCAVGTARGSGATRNLWTLRLEARLHDAELRQINQHLQAIFALLRAADNDSDAPLHAVTWAIAPIHERVKTRQ